MKKSILTLGMIAMLFAGTLTSCKNNEAKVEDAQEDVLEEKQDVAEAQNEANQEYENYKMEINEKITKNEQKIADLKVKKITGSADAQERHNRRIAKLEARNSELKAKLDQYTTYSADTWEAFKADVDSTATSIERDFESDK